MGFKVWLPDVWWWDLFWTFCEVCIGFEGFWGVEYLGFGCAGQERMQGLKNFGCFRWDLGEFGYLEDFGVKVATLMTWSTSLGLQNI